MESAESSFFVPAISPVLGGLVVLFTMGIPCEAAVVLNPGGPGLGSAEVV